MTKRILFAFALAALVALQRAAVPAQAADKPPYTIDAVLSLTGPAAFVGTGSQRTLRILQDVVNRSGGVHGAPVAFKFLDDQSSPQAAVELMNGLIADKVPVVIGPGFAATCGAVVPIIKTNIVAFCLSPALHPDPGTYAYSSGMSTNDILLAAVRYFRDKGLHRIALITSSDASGQDGERAFDRAMALPENKAMVEVANEHFNPTDVTVSTQIARMAQAKPDAIFAWTTGSPFTTVLRGITEAGLKIPVATSTGNMSYQQMTLLSQFDTGNLYAVAFRYFGGASDERGPSRRVVDAFLSAYEAAHVKPDVQPGLVWDAGLLIVSALRSLGEHPTAAEIKHYIDAQTAFAGIDGTYNFAAVPQRGIDDRAAVMTKWDGAVQRWVVVSRPGGGTR